MSIARSVVCSPLNKPSTRLGKDDAGFYLRVFLEQFARRLTGLKGRVTGEEIISTYTNTLPIAYHQLDDLITVLCWTGGTDRVRHQA
jgi:hypothetical protein